MKKHLLPVAALLLAACHPGTVRPEWTDLTGRPAMAGNPTERRPDGLRMVRDFHAPALRILRTRAEHPKGTVLVLPGGGYAILANDHEGARTAEFLNDRGFDAAILEYHVAAGGGPAARALALADARAAWDLLRKDAEGLGVHHGRLGILGYSAGGHLAARLAQTLEPAEQPDDLMLVYPAYLQEPAANSVMPAVLPPLAPRRLFLTIAANDRREWVEGAETYAKTWAGYGGEAAWKPLADGGHGFGMDATRTTGAAKGWTDLLQAFLDASPTPKRRNAAAEPVQQGGTAGRHGQKVAQARKHRYALLMVGDSITHSLNEIGGRYDALRPVWRQYFEPRDALNLGYSGARTENILWNLEHGELDGQAPKVVTLMVGTNNVDEKHYPVRSTAPELAEGTAAIVRALRRKLPDAKILLLRPFPGSYDGDLPTSHRLILERAGDLLKPLADGEHVFYLDVNPSFLKPDGGLRGDLFFDHLHPNQAGAKAWAEAMEPTLSKLMGDAPVPANGALAPVPALEHDGYDWQARHAAVLAEQEALDPDLVFVGDSITHAWGGVPQAQSRHTGEAVLRDAFAGHRVLNCGFGWDRTQNVLWRLDHGELDGLHPRAVVVHIGTNNLTPTDNAGPCTPREIAEGVAAVCARVRAKCPDAKIVLMKIFPRWSPSDPRRAALAEVNRRLEEFAKERRAAGDKTVLLDLAPEFLEADGSFKPGVMGADLTHPAAGGYAVWAKAVQMELER